MKGSALDRLARSAACALVTSACYVQSPAIPIPARQAAALGSVVDTSAWQNRHPRSLAEMLEGQFPGVEVRSAPGGGMSVRIRGVSSFVLGTEPLYVVDGIPAVVGPRGVLEDVDPEEVARIEVLKGPAASALWGSRGANGVVLITRKHP